MMATTNAQAVGAWEGPNTVEDLMSPSPAVVRPDAKATVALDLMVRGGCHHLPVVDDEGMLCGVVSEHDLLAHAVPNGISTLKERPVREIMRSSVEVATLKESITDAAARMAARRVGCLPVVADGRLVGILTRTDVLAERGRLLFKTARGEVPCARTIMTPNPRRVRRQSDVIDAVLVMVRHGIRHLPVVDVDGEALVGMLSERDVRSVLGDAAMSLAGRSAKLEGTSVATAMWRSPATVQPDASLFEIAHHFVEERVGAVAVVDEMNRLLGIISYVDLLRYLLVPNAR